ncbi:trans-aconitate 2-methyltransferase [Rhodovulum visakhapatnamense]|uniref:Trans-aconitate 2-methyltransferase n=1 Tax=Rhodovulum visakhapatnamense TaxID=364297 RepID=A0A4R8FRX3_9RHOB|nr:methyltransferase domain-containing protein [Rhodovulum visakhapatnamense]TDX28216.1 trans-aconitate 2-methyltransferase [Rhodovulum visakhapatnamense]
MSPHGFEDWNPGTYARFRGLRLRPALDLLAQVPELPEGGVVDLGCGNGAVAGALRMRFPRATLTGVDSSPAMLDEARVPGLYDRLIEADAATWTPEAPVALIFSNALCHWLPDHAGLFARLARALGPGGTLAVQMPRQFAAPSHALMREIAARCFPDRFDFSGWVPPVAEAAAYARILAPLGTVSAWETSYVQRLDPAADGHPVRRFTEATALRPFAAKLDGDELAAFLTEYETALDLAYPAAPDGSVLFPFTRVFFTLTV